MDDSLPELGDLEREVMQLVWANGPVTAEAVRERLSRPLKESTVRTVLRRLEDKGYTTHTVDGRTYVYHAAEPRGRVAAKAVQRIVDWFCNGSVEEVLVGMVDRAMLDQRQLRMLAILAESALRSLLLGGVVWIGLNLLRVRNPHVHMTCWLMVLVASLSMPLLMRWTTVTVTVNNLPVPATATEHLWPAGGSWSGPSVEPLQDMLATGPSVAATVSGSHNPPMNWLALATIVYALVAGLLLLRLAVGLYLTWRLARAAKPMRESWTADWSVRVSGVIAGPVTFGSTILLPPQCFDWDVRKRQAVLAHEGAHVANRDFYLLLLAALNRSVFWFSPFAWWHHTRLSELAEIISDATALEVVEDRLSYAEILLDLVQHVRRAPAGIEMARACTVRSRV